MFVLLALMRKQTAMVMRQVTVRLEKRSWPSELSTSFSSGFCAERNGWLRCGENSAFSLARSLGLGSLQFLVEHVLSSHSRSIASLALQVALHVGIFIQAFLFDLIER